MKLSILIAVYNEECFIAECLDSIFECDGLDYEVVVIDDFSEDSTLAKLKDYIAVSGVENLIVGSNDRKGKNNAFNKAYSLASGNVFCFVGGDDRVQPCTLKGRAQLLENIPGAAVSLCKIKTFSDDPKLDGLIYPKKAGVGALAGGAMLFNRAFAEIVFPLPPTLPNEDTWLKLAIRYFHVEVYHYPYISYFYRQHSNNSVKLSGDFLEFSSIIAKRNHALFLFKDRFSDVLESDSLQGVDSEIELEDFRANGKAVSIFFMKGVSFREKLSAILLCNSFLYSIRVLFYRVLAGK